jgi:hypothetical protein
MALSPQGPRPDVGYPPRSPLKHILRLGSGNSPLASFQSHFGSD